jgi:hypothetical protein
MMGGTPALEPITARAAFAAARRSPELRRPTTVAVPVELTK